MSAYVHTRVSNGTGPTQDRADVWGTNLSIGWDVSDGLSIKSITGYREMDAAIKVDMDQSPFPIVHTDEVQSENQFSQELQFSGASADKKLHWLVGAYYFRERAHDRNQTLLASGLYDALGLLPAAIVPLIPGIRDAGSAHVVERNAVFVSWRVTDGRRLRLSANLSDEPQDFPLDRGQVVWHEGGAPQHGALPPWTVRWTIAA